MDKICPICKKKVEQGMIDVCQEAYQYIIEQIKEEHPDWVKKDGACPKCVERYEKL